MINAPSQPYISVSHIEPVGELAHVFKLMRQLRPHLSDVEAFKSQIIRQQQQGYALHGAWQTQSGGQPQLVGLAGYRLQENLFYSRFLYVDDLVISAQARGGGIGATLLSTLADLGRQQQCQHLVLDTSLANSLAQRFYFRQGLLATALHFSCSL